MTAVGKHGKGSEELVKKMSDIINPENTEERTVNLYDGWATEYEQDLKTLEYGGHKLIAKHFFKLEMNKDVRILDVLAGTGLISKLLMERGYTNIDGLDGSEEMMKVALENKMYKSYFCCFIGGDKKAPIEDATYDVLVSSGSFVPGHINSDVFPELLRITKVGGIIIVARRASSYENTPLERFDDDVDKLVSSGVWEFVSPRTLEQDYYIGEDGYVYVLKKLK